MNTIHPNAAARAQTIIPLQTNVANQTANVTTVDSYVKSSSKLSLASFSSLRPAGDKVTKLIKQLKRKGGDVYQYLDRRDAIRQLGELKDSRAVLPLIAHLEYPDDRNVTIKALGALGDARAVLPLIAYLKGREYHEYHNETISALGALGDARAVLPVLDFLREENGGSKETRRRAALALGAIGTDRAWEGLKIAFDTDSEILVRGVALIAMAKINPGQALPLVEKAINAGGDIKEYAVYAARFIEDAGLLSTIIRVATDIQATWIARHEAVRVLSAYSSADVFDAVASVMKEYKLNRYANSLRNLAMTSLYEMNAYRAIPHLIETLQDDPDPDTRLASAKILGKARDIRALAPLREHLKVEKSLNVRNAVFEALWPLELIQIRNAAPESIKWGMHLIKNNDGAKREVILKVLDAMENSTITGEARKELAAFLRAEYDSPYHDVDPEVEKRLLEVAQSLEA